jgi:hypothetical protein
MVESETFVSRRRHQMGRRPRKLFTARGLVKEDGVGQEQQTSLPSARVPVKNTVRQPFPQKNNNSPHMVIIAKDDKRSSDAPEQGHGTANVIDSAPHTDVSNSGSTGNDGASSRFSDDSLENVLQMGCMDGLFFSGAVDKSRNRVLAFEPHRHKDEPHGLPMPQLQNFMARQSPTTFDVSHKAHSSHPNGFACQMLPYQTFRDQISEDKIFRGNLLMYQPGNPVRQFDMSMRNELVSSHFAQHPFDSQPLDLSAPPSHIFIGEQPCFSEDLIPVDDMSPAESSINLTKYHPKPLVHRPDHAFDKPMFSVDSEDDDSDHSAVDSEKRTPIRSASPAIYKKVMPTVGAKAVLAPKMKSTIVMEDEIGPSFDNDDGICIDKPPIDDYECPSFERDMPVIAHHKFEEGHRAEKTTDVLPFPAERVVKSVTSIEALESVGGSSLEESAASDEAITSEKPKRVKSWRSLEESAATDKAISPETLKPKPNESWRSRDCDPLFTGKQRYDDPELDSEAAQDENGGPSEKLSRPSRVNRATQSNEQTAVAKINNDGPSEKYNNNHGQAILPPPRPGSSAIIHESIHSGALRRRKPFDLMSGMNVQTAHHDDDDEWMLSPKPRASQSVPRKATPNRGMSSTGRVGTPTSRFGFEESFDETEFFDTTMT